MEAWLTRRWYGGSAPFALRPLSWLYGGAMALRKAVYANGVFPSFDAGKPVLVVGNLTAGGTGKTPLVIWFARELSRGGFKVGIVSRGHGRSESAPRRVEEGNDWRLVGDEPMVLARNTGCPVVVAADRVAGARQLAALGVDLIVADDGLQHLRLRRDCEIAVIDGTRGLGNGALLPAGPLREPASRLASVDAIVVNGSPDSYASPANGAFVMALEGDEPRPVAAMASTGAVSSSPSASGSLAPRDSPAPEATASTGFAGQRVHAVAGIGNPARFFAALRSRGLEVIEHPFPDHHPYTAADFAFGDALPVLMTEKDAVKCRAFADPRMWYVPVVARFGEREGRELLERVLRKLGLTAHQRG